MKCVNCPALRVEGYEYPEEYCAAGVPETSMVEFKDGSGCRYSAKQIAKRTERRDRMQDHQYDGIDVWIEESDGKEQAMRTAITSALEQTHMALCYKSDLNGKIYEADLFRQRELPSWLRWAYEEEEEKVQKGFCEKCKWHHEKRYQKCTCCRRNRRRCDNYKEEP